MSIHLAIGVKILEASSALRRVKEATEVRDLAMAPKHVCTFSSARKTFETTAHATIRSVG